MSRKQTDQPRRDAKLDDSEVIAERTYFIKGSDPPDSVKIRLGRPTKRESDGLFTCGAEVEESGRVWTRQMVGADGVEALRLALMIIGVDLKHIHGQLEEGLSWEGSKGKDLAFPTPPEYSLKAE
jgi:hypothetical protein